MSHTLPLLELSISRQPLFTEKKWQERDNGYSNSDHILS